MEKLSKTLKKVVDLHFENYYNKSIKDGTLLKGRTNSIIYSNIYGLNTMITASLCRSFESSLGSLFDKLLNESSVFFNGNSFTKINVTSKKIVKVDLGFERNGEINIFENKLHGELDNKKSEVEKTKLIERYEILQKLHPDKKINFFLGVVGNKNGGVASNWDKGRVGDWFSDDEIKVEEDLYNYISGDENFFPWFVSEIMTYIGIKYSELEQMVYTIYNKK
jgi:hypothetical protein